LKFSVKISKPVSPADIKSSSDTTKLNMQNCW